MLVHFSLDAKKVSGESASESEEIDDVGSAGIGAGIGRVEPRAAVSVDHDVSFNVFPERLHFFDAESHEAVV
jgi:hypothetical protein